MNWKCFFLGCRWKLEGEWLNRSERLKVSNCERCGSHKVEAP